MSYTLWVAAKSSSEVEALSVSGLPAARRIVAALEAQGAREVFASMIDERGQCVALYQAGTWNRALTNRAGDVIVYLADK